MLDKNVEVHVLFSALYKERMRFNTFLLFFQSKCHYTFYYESSQIQPTRAFNSDESLTIQFLSPLK